LSHFLQSSLCSSAKSAPIYAMQVKQMLERGLRPGKYYKARPWASKKDR
jgi:hypothetical protein